MQKNKLGIMHYFVDKIRAERIKYKMKTLQENLETVEDCRSRKYENSLEYETEEMSVVEHKKEGTWED